MEEIHNHSTNAGLRRASISLSVSFERELESTRFRSTIRCFVFEVDLSCGEVTIVGQVLQHSLGNWRRPGRDLLLWRSESRTEARWRLGGRKWSWDSRRSRLEQMRIDCSRRWNLQVDGEGESRRGSSAISNISSRSRRKQVIISVQLKFFVENDLGSQREGSSLDPLATVIKPADHARWLGWYWQVIKASLDHCSTYKD